jgi:superfamily II DNA or RNA helicase
LLTLPTLDKDSVETAIGSKQTELQQWGRGIRPDITAKLRGLEDNPAKLKSYLESIVHPRSKQQ